ncbi:hypothetical protein CEXT_630561, partial [Caerostris extrusa]
MGVVRRICEAGIGRGGGMDYRMLHWADDNRDIYMSTLFEEKTESSIVLSRAKWLFYDKFVFSGCYRSHDRLVVRDCRRFP